MQARMGESYSQADMFEKPREACGVFGVYAPDMSVAQITYSGLLSLQHRGQDGAGVFINGEKGLVGVKDIGLVTEAIPDGAITLDSVAPEATIGVGHVRYGTVRAKDKFAAIQPLTGESTQLALAHNGHIENMDEVVWEYGQSPEAYATDTQALTALLDALSEPSGDLQKAMEELLPKLHGAYSLVLTDGEGLIAARDPWGIRPLSWGEIPGTGHIVASETPAIEQAGGIFVRDVYPGEILRISGKGVESSFMETGQSIKPKHCAFEYVYIARPDSNIEGQYVYATRERAGMELAREHPADADVVIGIPDSGTAAAIGFAKESDISFEQGFFKDVYSSRSFIANSQAARKRIVAQKLRPNKAVIAGKRVVVVDDSVVRGTTMSTVVEILRNAGAAEVHLRIPSSPYKYPCFYGVDTGDITELLAHNRDVETMREFLGVDSLAFLSHEGLERAIALQAGLLCMACVTGTYPTPLPNRVFLGMPASHKSRTIG